MSSADLFGPMILPLASLLAGFVLGFLYFEALRRTTRFLAAGDRWFKPVALTIGRILIAVAVLAGVARAGAVALLVTFAGFLLARTVELYRSGRAR